MSDAPDAPDESDAELPRIRPPTFDRIAVRLLVVALVAGVLTAPILILWRDFSWLMALSSAAGVALLIFFSGRAVRILRFEWRRPPFERED